MAGEIDAAAEVTRFDMEESATQIASGVAGKAKRASILIPQHEAATLVRRKPFFCQGEMRVRFQDAEDGQRMRQEVAQNVDLFVGCLFEPVPDLAPRIFPLERNGEVAQCLSLHR